MLEAVGRATITSNEGEGLYVVNADYGVTEVSRQIASLEAEAAALQSAADELTPKIAAAESDRNSKQLALNVAISALTGDDPDDSTAKSAVDNATQELLQALATKEVLEAQIGRASARLATIEGKVEALQSLTLTADKFAWCCDYTLDATGQVATVEINGEQPQLLISPGAEAPVAGDGLMTHRLAMSPAATFVNWAILPGWQKFAPTYRVGVISNIDTGQNVATVTLDAAASSAQGLKINQDDLVLVDVPVEYLDCNALAFEEEDRVIVKFVNQSWAEPKVIGFERNPRPCELRIWVSANRGRVDGPSTFYDRITTVHDGEDLNETANYYINGIGLPYECQKRSDTAYCIRSGGIYDLKTGFLAKSASFVNQATNIAISPTHYYKADGVGTSAVYLSRYEWDSNLLVNQVPWPDFNATYGGGSFGISADARSVVVPYLRPRPDGTGFDHFGVSVFDPDLTLRWKKDEFNSLGDPGAADGTGVGRQVYGVSVTGSHAAVLYPVFEEGNAFLVYYITIFDVNTGDVVRRTKIEQADINALPAAVQGRPEDITMRGEDVYVLLRGTNGSRRVRSLIKYNGLTGSFSSPDLFKADIHAAYQDDTDDSLGDFGSMD